MTAIQQAIQIVQTYIAYALAQPHTAYWAKVLAGLYALLAKLQGL